jgi:hypothetical protein
MEDELESIIRDGVPRPNRDFLMRLDEALGLNECDYALPKGKDNTKKISISSGDHKPDKAPDVRQVEVDDEFYSEDSDSLATEVNND